MKIEFKLQRKGKDTIEGLSSVIPLKKGANTTSTLFIKNIEVTLKTEGGVLSALFPSGEYYGWVKVSK